MGVYRMKKLILVIALLFIGCDTPLDKNKKAIEKNTQKIENIQMQIQNNKENLKNLKKEIDDIKEKINKKSIYKVNNKVDMKIQKIILKLNELNKKINKNQDCLDYIVINPTTFITIDKANVYTKPNTKSKIAFLWDKHTTFTSYKEKDGFVKVTGYFIKNKWIMNTKSWWISKKDIAIKRLNK